MGTREESTRAKPSKPNSSVQETAPVTPSYPDWSSSMQAYYGAAAPPFFASPVASPSPHPYMWGAQHPFIPPYGTPAYPAMYAPGGVYAHPNMPPNPGMVQASMEVEGKIIHGKDRVSSKKSKATSKSASSGGKAGENGKITSGSGNDGGSESADSGSNGSSDASEDNTNEQERSGKTRSFNQMLADGANAQNTVVPGKPIVSASATNLSIGMDLWNASPVIAGTMRSSPTGVSSSVGREAIIPDSQWNGGSYGQDERELKKQKRKQSNRESARRSRLRKQAECEELQQRVEALNNENRSIRDEMQKLSEERDKLRAENSSIKERLTEACGPDGTSNLEDSNSVPVDQSRGDEGNS